MRSRRRWGSGFAGALLLVAAAIGLNGGGAGAARLATPAGTLVVATSGTGTVASVPAGVACPFACTASLPLDSGVTLTAHAGINSHFVGWSGDCAGAEPTCSLAVAEQTSVTASFAGGPPPPPPEAFPLHVTRSGNGRVVSSESGVIDCGTTCTTGFSGGGSVSLTATAGAGSTFAGWSGACTGTGPCVVSLTAARDVAAAFTRSGIGAGSSQLTVSNPQAPPPGYGETGIGSVKVTALGSSVVCSGTSCTYAIPNGATVTAVAFGGTFVRWSGGVCAGDASICTFTMDGNGTIGVSWLAGQPLDEALGLNVTHSRDGRVQSSPPGIDCGSGPTCSAGYEKNTVVRLSATPASGFAFSGWSGDCSGSGSCVVTMAASHSVTAVFKRARATMTVQAAGAGSGRIASDPAGIDCGADCAYPFPTGTAVSLRAVADDGSRFVGWSTTACPGSGVCGLTLTGPSTLTATFARCAAAATTGLSAVARRHPRTIVVSLTLADGAKAQIRVVRGRATLDAATRVASAGTQSFVLPIAKSTRAGRASVSVTIRDLCGGVRTAQRPLVIPR